MYRLNYFCISDIGKRRDNNQDNYLCVDRIMEPCTRHSENAGIAYVKQPTFLGIFDGMGGEQCGEKAAEISARTTKDFAINKNNNNELLFLCTLANQNVCNYADENNISSMGTTVAAMVFSKNKWNVLNVGDSKVLRILDGKISQISEDDVGFSIRGKKPPLSQCIGMREDECVIVPHIRAIDKKSGTRFVICSDGLTDMVENSTILSIVSNASSVEDATKTLVEEAMKNGGIDNTTVIVAELSKKKLWDR